MSDPFRVAFVVEGPTDLIMLKAAVSCLVPGREVVIQTLQPELSEAFQQPAGTLGGWSGIYRWCRQTADQTNGRVGANPLFEFHDLLVVQVDADVAGMTYESGRIDETVQDLPCQQDCPPPNATTDALRSVALRWMGEHTVPPKVVLCTPSKSLEAWVLAAFFPGHKWVKDGSLECRATPENQLTAAQPQAKRIPKTTKVYRSKAAQFAAAWSKVRRICTEAERFSTEFLQAVPP